MLPSRSEKSEFVVTESYYISSITAQSERELLALNAIRGKADVAKQEQEE